MIKQHFIISKHSVNSSEKGKIIHKNTQELLEMPCNVIQEENPIPSTKFMEYKNILIINHAGSFIRPQNTVYISKNQCFFFCHTEETEKLDAISLIINQSSSIVNDLIYFQFFFSYFLFNCKIILHVRLGDPASQPNVPFFIF